MKMQNLNEHLDEVQEKIDYYFNNTDLLLQAFTRSSYSPNMVEKTTKFLNLSVIKFSTFMS